MKSKKGWRDVGGRTIYFRSTWEANYARWLEIQKQSGVIKDWQHEPETFWFLKILRGTRSYLPDFKIIKHDDSHFWVEVKGYMDKRSATKLKRFAKYYPKERLEVVSGAWFKENKALAETIQDWE